MSRKHPSDRIILGVDPSLTDSGWAVLVGDNLKEYGRIKTTARCSRTKAPIPEAVRYFKIGEEFFELLERVQPDEVAMEQFETLFKIGGGSKKKSRRGGGRRGSTLQQILAGTSSSAGESSHENGNAKSQFLAKGAQAVLQHAVMRYQAKYPEREVRLTLYTQPEWKKGRAGKTKDWALGRVEQIFRAGITNDNEADAVMIAHHHQGRTLMRQEGGSSLHDWRIAKTIRRSPDAPVEESGPSARGGALGKLRRRANG